MIASSRSPPVPSSDDEQLREPPRDRGGGDAGQPAEQHRAPQAAPGADERGGDGGEDEHRLESLAEHDDRRVGDDRAAADAHVAERLLGRAQRVARPACAGDAGAAVERGEHAGVRAWPTRTRRRAARRPRRAAGGACAERVRLQRSRAARRPPVGGERAVESARPPRRAVTGGAGSRCAAAAQRVHLRGQRPRVQRVAGRAQRPLQARERRVPCRAQQPRLGPQPGREHGVVGHDRPLVLRAEVAQQRRGRVVRRVRGGGQRPSSTSATRSAGQLPSLSEMLATGLASSATSWLSRLRSAPSIVS